MPTVHIDGEAFSFEQGERLLQFCLDRGIEIPHFCYHPSMSVPANCRQCLVKVGTPVVNRETREVELDDDGRPRVQYMPKLQPGCALDMTDGMVVHTQYDSEEVLAAQADNLEIMLINHPLDCPICDQAGHCPLQNQAFKYGPEGSRFEFEKVHRPKRVQLGPHVVLDAERCINCTRCTRFTEEISGSNQLTIIQRGPHNYPMTAPGELFDEPYSMNVTDLCPVGALTEDYFRFKARVWEMSKTPTVSDFGARGTNVDVWVRDNQVLRITPRQNPEVNEYWMPDAARLVYDRYNTGRPKGPTIAGATVGWPAAFDAAADALRGGSVVFVGSAFATVEDNYLLVRLTEALGADTPRYIPHVEPGAGDDWLLTDDQAPNAAGCERLGMLPWEGDALRQALAAADTLYVLEDDPVAAGLLSEDDLRDKRVVVHAYHAANRTAVGDAVLLPAAMSVETIGTYVNDRGRGQLLRPAKAIRGMFRPLMKALGVGLSRLDRQGTPFDRWHDEGNRVDCQPGWISLPEIAARAGVELRYSSPAAIMEEAAGRIPALAGALHADMGLLGVALEEAEGVAGGR
jgi:NADH-quinone oxidoreductase subunit G